MTKKQIPYLPLYAVLWLFSKLPLGVMYVLSDLFFFILFYLVRYRRKLVKKQLQECFPEKSEKERRRIEKKFYHFLCDYFVETQKLITISRKEIMRRVRFTGIDQVMQAMEAKGKQFTFCYLGHYGNWEWVNSFSLHLPDDVQGGQIYHPLRNVVVDKFFLKLRAQFGGQSLPMKDTFRQIVRAKRENRKMAIGFIADQCPKWEAIHYWTDFLNHKTTFFVGTEKIAKQVDAVVCYAYVTRPKRGYYDIKIVLLEDEPKSVPDYEITDRYCQLLEEQIRQQPELWLWTHNRWKRTHEDWLKHFKNENKEYIYGKSNHKE